MKSQNKTEAQSEAIDAANKDVFRSVYLGRPLAARIVSRLGPFERWTDEQRETFLQLCDVARSVNLRPRWSAAEPLLVNDASDSLLWQRTLPSHVQLAPQVPFCNWSALQGSAPARPTPPPQTCCTDVKTFLLLLLFLAGWGECLPLPFSFRS